MKTPAANCRPQVTRRTAIRVRHVCFRVMLKRVALRTWSMEANARSTTGFATFSPKNTSFGFRMPSHTVITDRQCQSHVVTVRCCIPGHVGTLNDAKSMPCISTSPSGRAENGSVSGVTFALRKHCQFKANEKQIKRQLP